MPFDDDDEIENRPENEDNKPKRPGPILHTPKSGPDIPIKIILPIVLVILVSIGGYWIYKSKQPKQSEKPPVVVNMPQPDSLQGQPQNPVGETPTDTSTVKEQKPPTAGKEVKQGEMVNTPPQSPASSKSQPAKIVPRPKIKSSSGGDYTIFVGSFKDKQNAENLFSRWKQAGYPVSLTTKGTWYRVSLGKYPTKVEALQEAEKMREALTEGYFIGVID
ncbi:MAG: SPOR domain-containing protein [Bacteroidota bacterium]